MNTTAIALLLIAVPFFMSWGTCCLVKRWGPVVGLIDKPGGRKIHANPTPTGGGLGIWTGVIIPAAAISLFALGLDRDANLLWGLPLDRFPDVVAQRLPGVRAKLPALWTLLGLGSVLTALGALDDRYSLPWKLRLAVEFLVAVAAVAAGWRATFFVNLPLVTWPVSVLWIVGLVNSFNMLDNMDGLSAGVAGIAALFLTAVAFFFAPNPLSGEPQLFLACLLLILVGAILGFLKLNRPPAKMFMGDGGAYFIGFLLATLTLSITFVGGDAPKAAIFVPLVILAVPLYDTVSVVTIRLRNGKSPFEGDKNHYSHRLTALGLTRVQAVGTIYLTTAVCATGALFLYQVNFLCAMLILLQTALILALVAILEFAARKKIREEESQIDALRELESKRENDKTKQQQ